MQTTENSRRLFSSGKAMALWGLCAAAAFACGVLGTGGVLSLLAVSPASPPPTVAGEVVVADPLMGLLVRPQQQTEQLRRICKRLLSPQTRVPTPPEDDYRVRDYLGREPHGTRTVPVCVAVFPLGCDRKGFGRAGDVVWSCLVLKAEPRAKNAIEYPECNAWQVTNVLWINARTGAIESLFPVERKESPKPGKNS